MSNVSVVEWEAPSAGPGILLVHITNVPLLSFLDVSGISSLLLWNTFSSFRLCEPEIRLSKLFEGKFPKYTTVCTVGSHLIRKVQYLEQQWGILETNPLFDTVYLI